jgi:hypothetical protein
MLPRQGRSTLRYRVTVSATYASSSSVEKNRRLYPNPVAFTIRCAALARLVSQKISCAFATNIHTALTAISYGVRGHVGDLPQELTDLNGT